MKKLLRFLILTVLFAISVTLIYSMLPAIVWVFGGSFTEVAQSVPYVLFGGIMTVVAVGIVFSDCFNEEFC
jgi:hypothetical protein